MPEDVISKAQEPTAQKTAEPVQAHPLLERRGAGRRAATVPVWLIGGLTCLLVVAVAYWLWPRSTKRAVAVETPPIVEARHAGEGLNEHSQEGAIEVDDETAELVGIKTDRVAGGEIEDSIATVGRVLVAPNGQAVVGARVEGRAVRVMAEPGQSVQAGQVLVVIDSLQVADLRGQLIEAEARLRLAEQNLARTGKSENRAAVIQAKNKLDFAQNTLERKRRLVALGGVAERDVAQAEVEYKNAQAEYDYLSNIQVTREQQQATSELEQWRAVAARLAQSLAALGANASRQGGIVNITSPIAGTVVDRHISIGQTVTQGSEMLTVMNLASVIIEAQVPESQAAQIKAGQRLVARLPGLPDRPFEGRVESLGHQVDPQKRTVAVRARMTNAGALLKHEMAVEVRIATGARRNGLLAPVSALVDDEGVPVVYVKEGNRYERRMVRVGTSNYQAMEILSGVAAGEEVVTTGAYQLKNMQKGGAAGDHHDEH